jgi:hypothetical protein
MSRCLIKADNVFVADRDGFARFPRNFHAILLQISAALRPALLQTFRATSCPLKRDILCGARYFLLSRALDVMSRAVRFASPALLWVKCRSTRRRDTPRRASRLMEVFPRLLLTGRADVIEMKSSSRKSAWAKVKPLICSLACLSPPRA